MRGKIIPVVNLALRLELPTSEASDKRALIIETTGREIGIVVDEVTEVIRIQDSAVEPWSTTTGNGYVRGIGKDGSRLLILLDADKLFSDEDMQVIEKVG